MTDRSADRSADIEAVARALLEARGLGPETLHQHHEWEDYPTDAEQKYIGLDGVEHVTLMHFAWRKRVAEATAAIEALRPFHAAAEAKARLDAYEDAAGIVPGAWPLGCAAVRAAILQRGGEK